MVGQGERPVVRVLRPLGGVLRQDGTVPLVEYGVGPSCAGEGTGDTVAAGVVAIKVSVVCEVTVVPGCRAAYLRDKFRREDGGEPSEVVIDVIGVQER